MSTSGGGGGYEYIRRLHRGMFSTSGDTMSTSGGYEYIRQSHRGMFSTSGDTMSTSGDIMSTSRGYHEYIEGIS